MRVFKDVQLVEHIGSGIPRILKKYERSIFNFSANFLRITFPVPEAVIARMNAIDADKVPISADKVSIGADKMLVENPQYLKIINYLGSHESVTNSIVVRLLGVKSTRAKVILRNMVENNLLESLGENRSRRYVRKFNRSK
jgi:predicted HTH transcriptional regulator